MITQNGPNKSNNTVMIAQNGPNRSSKIYMKLKIEKFIIKV